MAALTVRASGMTTRRLLPGLAVAVALIIEAGCVDTSPRTTEPAATQSPDVSTSTTATCPPPGAAERPAGAPSSCSIGGIEFVELPGGEFAMGDGSQLSSPNEQPVHDVTLDAFWVARTELTLERWNEFLAATGHARGRAHADTAAHPVVGITWEDATAFSDWFSNTYGVVVRLPSEAEWEYAARGGLADRQYPNGDVFSPQDANYSTDGAVRVASYPPNAYGLYDMAGNVYEWVGDWYDLDYYASSPSTNPRGPETQPGASQRRADRGGGWCAAAERLRVSARHAGPLPLDEGGTAECLGVRLMMEAGEP